MEVDLSTYRKLCGIYKIRNTVNNKIYIGSSEDIIRRLRQHRSSLIRQVHRNPKLQASWNKYGSEYFEFSHLLSCRTEELLYQEQLAINTFNPEFNICLIAGNTKGRLLSQSTKEKLRNINLGKTYGIETKAKVAAASKLMWEKKRTKDPQFFKRLLLAANQARYKSVDCICLKTGIVIKSYSSLVATREDGFQSANISAVCRGKRNQAHGYGWSWSE